MPILSPIARVLSLAMHEQSPRMEARSFGTLPIKTWRQAMCCRRSDRHEKAVQPMIPTTPSAHTIHRSRLPCGSARRRPCEGMQKPLCDLIFTRFCIICRHSFLLISVFITLVFIGCDLAMNMNLYLNNFFYKSTMKILHFKFKEQKKTIIANLLEKG